MNHPTPQLGQAAKPDVPSWKVSTLRLEAIQENLAENETLFRQGKRKRALYAVCKRDGRRRIAQIKAGQL